MLNLAKTLVVAALLAPGVALAASTVADPIHRVGDITFHPKKFVGKHVIMRGFLLKQETGYALVSDESGGKIGPRDLPVTGAGLELMKPNTLFIIEGNFLDKGLTASNNNKYHLELTVPPKPDKP